MAEDERRVVVRLPNRLLEALDAYTGARKRRSAAIRESVEYFLAQKERLRLREQLIAGYQELGRLAYSPWDEEWDVQPSPED